MVSHRDTGAQEDHSESVLSLIQSITRGDFNHSASIGFQLARIRTLAPTVLKGGMATT